LAVAEELGVEHDVVLYIKEPPDRATLEKIVKGLEDPVEDLVRKDAKFKKLGLDPDDFVGDPEAVVDILVAHKQLLQRPLIVKGSKAIIGRPKDRIAPFIG
jgi:arsenate reductase